MELDDVIIATTSQPRVIKLARWLKPKRIIGFGAVAGLDLALPLDDAVAPRSRRCISRRVNLRHGYSAARLPGVRPATPAADSEDLTHDRHPHQCAQTVATLAGSSALPTPSRRLRRKGRCASCCCGPRD
jgi:hypothetical protein